jgi:gas vesicle protein
MPRWPRLTFCTAAVAITTAFSPSISKAQFGAPFGSSTANQQRGAVTGGIAGAVAGGLIGDNNGEAGAGAAIGGVLGAVAGGIFGNARDKEVRYQDNQRQYVQQQQQAVVKQSSVSIADIVSMSRSGLSETVIINQIQSRGVLNQPQVSDIIAMHQQGVSERVISAMQQAPTASQRLAQSNAPQPVAIQRVYTPAPVYVEEHVVVPHYPVPVYRHYHGRHGGRRMSHPRSGVHIRF